MIVSIRGSMHDSAVGLPYMSIATDDMNQASGITPTNSTSDYPKIEVSTTHSTCDKPQA